MGRHRRAPHHANRITVKLADSAHHELLLVRLRHPAGRAATGSPTWLLEQPDFRALLDSPA